MTTIDGFIAAVAASRRKGLYNPWSQSCPTEIDTEGFKARQNRFRRHLQCPSPRMLLIGEAPGYQGCRYSGVPFASERLLLGGRIPRMPDLQGVRITSRRLPWSEPSSTIVWDALRDLGLAEDSVLFNAVPWHPEGERGPHSNRTPTRAERQDGLAYLEMFLGLFDNVAVTALGNTASETLETLGVRHTKVRHPANGGAVKFRRQLRALAVPQALLPGGKAG